MKPLLLSFVALCHTVIVQAQECSCKEEFLFVKAHIEKNHPGFNKRIKSPDEPHYKRFTDSLYEGIKDTYTEKYCIAYLKHYILYLQDHHSNYTPGNGTPVNDKDSAAVAAFLKSPAFLETETAPVNREKINSYLENSTDPIEGIYTTADGTYEVAVMKNAPFRDYYAIILQSVTPLWKTGQVKFELNKDNQQDGYHYFVKMRNHRLSYEWIPVDNKSFSIPGWIKKGAASIKSETTNNEVIHFTILDSQTTHLRIRSFNAALSKQLDSAYKVIIPQIKKYPKLIIDVRDNGGGSDWSYNALMPLLYTDTIVSDQVEIYNTPDNEAAYRRYDSIAKSRGNNPVFTYPLSKMKKETYYSFVPMGDGTPDYGIYPVNKGYPEKIAILYNRGCASACESLLFDARFSRKTLLIGENSGGYTGYGNVMNITTPCGNTLSWTTTVYKDQWRYEFVGIPPHIRIPENEGDWVEYTRRAVNR